MGVLNGKVAIVTGAGRGIGKQIASRLARDGAKVVLNDIAGDGVHELEAQLRAEGLEAVAREADISQVEQVRQLAAAAVDLYGGLDILVNNAAIDPTADFFEVDEESWTRIVHTNQKGVFFCTQACAPRMIARGGGRVINIGSVHGDSTMPRYAVYASTKGAINALTRQLSIDLAKYGITVNTVSPGATAVEKFVGQPWYDEEAIGGHIPLGRIGRPSEIAAVISFLAGDESAFITGQNITVDGGLTARLALPLEV